MLVVPAGALIGDAAASTTPKSRMSPMFMSGLLAIVSLDPDAIQTFAAAGRRVGQDAGS
jgi:hypothetical protein